MRHEREDDVTKQLEMWEINAIYVIKKKNKHLLDKVYMEDNTEVAGGMIGSCYHMPVMSEWREENVIGG